MNTIQLLERTNHKEICSKMWKLYRRGKLFTLKAISRIKQSKIIKKQDHKGEEIVIREHIDEDLTKYRDTATNMYSLSFRKRDKVFNLPISEATLATFEKEDILAHIIREVTRYGDENRMEKKKREILRRVKKAVAKTGT